MAHGAGSVIMPQLLTELGCEVYAINMDADGRFHRPPEPVADNVQGQAPPGDRPGPPVADLPLPYPAVDATDGYLQEGRPFPAPSAGHPHAVLPGGLHPHA